MSARTYVLLRALRSDFHLTLGTIGQHLGVTARTVSRWETHETLPEAHAPAVLELLRERDPKRARRLALELDIGGSGAVERARETALDHAIFVAARELDVSPRQAERVLGLFLTHLIATGMSLTEASDRLVEAGAVVPDKP